MTSSQHTHFEGKDALTHVQDKRQEASTEIHGQETAGHLAAALDSTRETAIFLLILWAVIFPFNVGFLMLFWILLLATIGWVIWKTGRSAWLAWSRLERLHRVMEQERWEITHHRTQERDELRALYSQKGFEGKLLEEVCDVLMADNERLLHVMLEEEMGFTLESYEHPLKEALGAFLGCLITGALVLFSYFLLSPYGFIVTTLLLCSIAAFTSAYSQKNKLIPAFVWNMGLGILVFATILFVHKIIFTLIIN